MDRLSKRLYMRPHSGVIRKFQSLKSIDRMQENPVVHIEGTNRIILVTICRIRQRLLLQAWDRLVHNTGVKHDWEADARIILSRKLPADELRTELEIEVLFRWIVATKDIDPTGIANTIFMCKKRSAAYSALQQLRLEFYDHGETVLVQGDIPSGEDGHFTILNGECEVLQFPEDSMPLMRLLYLAKKKKWDEVRKLLKHARVLAKIPKHSGFGELSTLTGVKRAATIRSCRKPGTVTEIAVLPKQALLECLKSRRGDAVQGAAPSEAMDFMRQSGLANRISPKDLVMAAKSMIRRTLMQGEILYYKGDPVKSMFLVVSGEFLLDTGDYLTDGAARPFEQSLPEQCYHLSSGSLLGDEGATGQTHCYSSTAAAVSEAAVVFEAVDFGFNFLTEKIGALRYCALSYKDKSRWSAPLQLAEEVNPYTYFNSLRKAIAYTSPYRGTRSDIYTAESAAAADAGEAAEAKAAAQRLAGHFNAGKGTKSSFNAATTAATTAAASPKKQQQQQQQQQKTAAAAKAKNPKAKMARTLRNLQGNVSFLLNNSNSLRPGNSMLSAASSNSFIGNHHQQHQQQKQRLLHGKSFELSPVGLHRALEINKTAKRLMERSLKVHAKENILFEQMAKELQQAAVEDPNGESEALAERTFKKYIAEYRQRSEQKTKEYLAQLAAERRRAMLASESKSAIRFFSTLTGDALELDDDDAEDNNNNNYINNGGDDNHIYHSDGVEGRAVTPTATANTAAAAAVGDNKKRRLTVDANAELKADAAVASPTPHHEYETDDFFSKPRIVQYFIWMDHLNRHTYRMLVSQAQQTIDFNRLEQQHMNLPQGISYQPQVTEESMKELAELFHRYGLTPADMNLSYRPSNSSSHKKKDSTAVAAQSLKNVLDYDSDNDNNNSSSSGKLRRAVGTPVPPLPLSQPSTAHSTHSAVHFATTAATTTTTTTAAATTPTTAALSRPGTAAAAFIASMSGSLDSEGKQQQQQQQRRSQLQVSQQRSAEDFEERRRRARLASGFKSYSPASWRDDIIKKSELGLADKVHSHFSRSATPDNRRVNMQHYHFPGHHHPDFESDHNYHRHLHRTHSIHPLHHHHHAAAAIGNNTGNTIGNIAGNTVGNTGRRKSSAAVVFDKRRGTITAATTAVATTAAVEDVPRELTLTQQVQSDILEHAADLQCEMDRLNAEHAAEIDRISELQRAFYSDPTAFMQAVAEVTFPVRKQHLQQYAWSTRFLKLQQGEVNTQLLQREAVHVHNPKLAASAEVEKSYSKAALLDSAKSIQEGNRTFLKSQDPEEVQRAVLLAVLNSRSFISFAMRGSSSSNIGGGFAADPTSSAAAMALLQRTGPPLSPTATAINTTTTITTTGGGAIAGVNSTRFPVRQSSVEFATTATDISSNGDARKGAMLEDDDLSAATQNSTAVATNAFVAATALTNQRSFDRITEQSTASSSSSPAHGNNIIASQRQSLVSPVVPPPHSADHSNFSFSAAAASVGTVIDNAPSVAASAVQSDDGSASATALSLILPDEEAAGATCVAAAAADATEEQAAKEAEAIAAREEEAVAEEYSRRRRGAAASAAAVTHVSAFQLAANAAVAAVEASQCNAAVVTSAGAAAATPNSKKRSIKSSFNAVASGDATIQRIKDLKHRLITEKPDSVALELYQSYSNTDSNPNPFFEGKRRSNNASKFALLRQLRGSAQDVRKASAAEARLIGVTSAAAVLEKEVALFCSVFPNATAAQQREFIERIQRRLQRGGGSDDDFGDDDDSNSSNNNSSSSVWTDDSFSYGFNVIAKEGERSRALKASKDEEIAAAARERAKLELSLISVRSENIGLIDPELAQWQQYTVQQLQQQQRAAKKTLPVLIVKPAAGASSRRFAVNKSKRWGGGTLVSLPSQQEKEPISGPSSYLDIYKRQPQVRTAAKDRQRILEELKMRSKAAASR